MSFIGRNTNSNVQVSSPVQQVVSYANASAVIDLSLGNIILVGALTGNLTLTNPVNAAAGKTYTWSFVQDATGGRTVTFPNGINYGSGTANQKFVVQFYYDGTDFIQIFGGV